MSPNEMMVGFFLLSCASRVRGCFRRWRQPVVRGPEWFFSVAVLPDFYAGPGRKILRDYRLRMFIPIVLEVMVAIAIFSSGKLSWLYWLIIAAAIAVHVNHLFSVDLAERQAHRVSPPEAEPVSSVVLSLTPRRLRDYTNYSVERFLVLVFVGTFAWLVRFYLRSPAEPSLRMVFGFPAVLLYTQLGMLFIKNGIVAWRTPIPQAQAEEHLQAREEARKLHLKVCDWLRISLGVQLMLWPLLISASPAMRPRLATASWLVIIGMSVLLGVFQEMGRYGVLKAMVRARPMNMPDLLHAESLSGPLCYQPDTPLLLVRGSHGYSLNLANRFTQLAAVYAAGLIMLLILLRMGH